MKHILTLTILLLQLSNSIAQDWQLLTTNTLEHLNDVYFINNDTGLVVGDNGTLLKTTDGGANWIQKQIGTTNHLKSITFVNSDVGFLNTSNEIFKTLDGGENWILQDTMDYISMLSFSNADTGFAMGAGRLIKTEDQGLTWNKFSCGCPHYITLSFTVAPNNNLFLGTTSSWIYTSSYNGTNWTSTYNNNSSYNLDDIFFLNNNVGYAVSGGYYQNGNGGSVMKTNDGGDTWNNIFDYPIWFQSTFFLDTNVGFCVGSEGRIIKTYDGGANWNELNTNSYYNWNTLKSVFFADYSTGYCVGNYGTIIKTTNGGITSSSSQDLKSLKLYPNPVINELTVENIKPNSIIEIYNLDGKILIKSSQTKTDVSSLNNGVYLVKIKQPETPITTYKLIKQ